MITGKIQNLAGFPVAGIRVSIHSHPEYGAAFTDSAGRFTIPVEGGYTITIVYQKESLITAHRKVYVPWNNIIEAETVQMIEQDPVATTITFDGNPNTVITHQSSQICDPFGSRSCTMVFTGDNSAYELDEAGNVIRELKTITTRATEFATPESMPAKLPPNSGYTYCSEFSLDQAQRVVFDKPVMIWVDNFLGFDVGEVVPVGYYDRDRGVWVPHENGVVVRLLDINSDGIIDALDADGDGGQDDLNSNGSFSDEVTGLSDAKRYPPGSTFWRVGLSHFTPWDCNWPHGPPDDAIPPNPEGEPDADEQKEEEKDCKIESSSFVEERSRIFHEDISVPGTDITIHYASNRVKGYKSVITVPASGEKMPASLKKIIVKVEIAGQILEKVLDPLPNQNSTFVWDGFDHLGRPVSGSITAHVNVGFVYDGVYFSPGNFERAFAKAGSDVTGLLARQEVTFWKRDILRIRAGISGIGEGWTLSACHQMNPMDISVLNKGDGTTNKNNVNIIETVAGDGTEGYSGDGGPAAQAKLRYPHGVAVDASGNLFITDTNNHCIRKVDTSGTITTVAGDGAYGYSGDGGPAAQAKLRYPHDVAVDASGNLYITDTNNHCIRKVDNSGTITTLAGDRTSGYSGDGGPAAQAKLYYPYSLAVDASGNLYIADYYNQRVCKVGFSYVFAGTMTAGDIPFAEANGLGHIMSSAGCHKQTISLDTDTVLYEFGYDDDDNLVSITDRFGNKIVIHRDASGVPTGITSPEGITTSLTIDANNHLTRITYPDSSFYDFEYKPDGLLTAKIDPEGNSFEHNFDSLGRLTDTRDDEGGHWLFSRSVQQDGDIFYQTLTAEGNITSYLDHTYSTGAYTSVITSPTGDQTLFEQSADGLKVSKFFACGMELGFEYGIDQKYKFKYVKEMSEQTPTGLARITQRERTCQDTNSDDICDLIKEKVEINGKTTIIENNTLQSQKTVTSPERRTVTALL